MAPEPLVASSTSSRRAARDHLRSDRERKAGASEPETLQAASPPETIAAILQRGTISRRPTVSTSRKPVMRRMAGNARPSTCGQALEHRRRDQRGLQPSTLNRSTQFDRTNYFAPNFLGLRRPVDFRATSPTRRFGWAEAKSHGNYLMADLRRSIGRDFRKVSTPQHPIRPTTSAQAHTKTRASGSITSAQPAWISADRHETRRERLWRKTTRKALPRPLPSPTSFERDRERTAFAAEYPRRIFRSHFPVCQHPA